MTTNPSSIWKRPRTRLGWWAVGLAIAFVIMMLLNTTVFMRLQEDVAWRQTVLPFYGIFMVLCGLAAGITGSIAAAWKQERSWLVWLTILLGGFVVFFVLGEFLIPQ